MAFCNSCGSNLAPGAKFCTKCGAVVTGAPSAPAPVASSPAIAPGPAAPRTGGSAVKIILVVVAVVVIFGILGVATLGIIGVHIARRTHFTQDGNRVKVETPFGSVDTSKDPQQMAKDLGVDIYPGAQPQADGSAIANFGGVRTVAASFISSDPVDKVCDFYRSKFPNAQSSTSSENHCTIASTDRGNVVTITIEPSGNSTKIQISSVNKSSTNSN
jgi:zinc-ribbon domain